MATKPIESLADANKALKEDIKSDGLAGAAGGFLDLLKMLFQALIGCVVPVSARKINQRAKLWAGRRWYFGKNRDDNRVDELIAESGCCTGGLNSVSPNHVKAALKDRVLDMTEEEIGALLAEVRSGQEDE